MSVQIPRGLRLKGDLGIDDYKYLFLDSYELFFALKMNDAMVDEVSDILTVHRGRKNTVMDIIIEYFITQKQFTGEFVHIFVLEGDHIIGMARIVVKSGTSRNGYISAVHVRQEHRGKKICQTMIRKLLELTNNEYQVERFTLDADPKNPPAIKCYEKAGFVKDIIDDDNVRLIAEY